MKNPITQERLQQLQDEATDLLKNFGKAFGKSYANILFKKAMAKAKADKKDKWKLQYREVSDDYWLKARPGSHTCECYVRVGGGPGAFGDWKKVYVVEQDDNFICIYADNKAYSSGKKPLYKISPAGYKAVNEVTSYYVKALNKIAAAFGKVIRSMFSGQNATNMLLQSRKIEVDFESLLTPRFQLNFANILRISCVTSNCCGITGPQLKSLKPREKPSKEPEGAGSERRDDARANFQWMQACVTIAGERCNATQQTTRMAFRKACAQLPEKVAALKEWSDNGTEPEILISMLVEALIPTLRDPILEELNQLKIPLVSGTKLIKIKLKAWNTALEKIMDVLTKLLTPAWEEMQKQAKKLDTKIEQVIAGAMSKILDLMSSVWQKITGKSGDKVKSDVDSHTTPLIQPIIDAFECPLKQGFEIGRKILRAELRLEKLPKDVEQRRAYLDELAKRVDVETLRQSTDELVASLRAMKTRYPEKMEYLNIEMLRSTAERMLLQTLDAVPYTLCKLLEQKEPLTNELIEQLLRDYDSDTVVQREDFVKKAAVKILKPPLMKKIKPGIMKVADSLSGLIPSEFQEFMDIEYIVNTSIKQLLQFAIDQGFTMAVKAVSTVRTTDAKRDDSAAEQLQQATERQTSTTGEATINATDTDSQYEALLPTPPPPRSSKPPPPPKPRLPPPTLPKRDYDESSSDLNSNDVKPTWGNAIMEMQHQMELMRDARHRLSQGQPTS